MMRMFRLGLLLGVALCAPTLACAQTATAIILPNAKTQFLDASGHPLANGKVYFYIPNTTTPQTTWADPYENTANPNPITLDASGEAIIFGSGIYRQVVHDQFSNLIWDALTGGYNCTGGSGGGGTPAGSTGQLQYNQSGAFAALAFGTSTTLLHGNASGAPTWSSVNLGTDVSGGGTGVPAALTRNVNSNSGLALVNGSPAIGDCLKWSASGVQDAGASCSAPSVPGGFSGSVQYNNSGVFAGLSLGTTTTVLHGNAAGVGAYGSVNLLTDVSNYLPAGVNAQTGTSYAVASTDVSKLLTLSNSSGVAVTLPQATGATYGAGFWFAAQNVGSGNVTLTPVTSTINGASSLVIPANSGVSVISDGTNWQISGELAQPFISRVSPVTDGSGACTASSISGGANGGKFTTSTGCSSNSVILSLPTSPHGWTCNAQDQTTPADSLKQSANTTASATLTGTTANSDVIVFACMGW